MTQPEVHPATHTFTSEQRERVVAALTAKLGSPIAPCAMCANQAWRIANSLLLIAMSPIPVVTMESGHAFGCIGLICQVCGNTVLLDTDKLGLNDLIPGVPVEGETPGEVLGS